MVSELNFCHDHRSWPMLPSSLPEKMRKISQWKLRGSTLSVNDRIPVREPGPTILIIVPAELFRAEGLAVVITQHYPKIKDAVFAGTMGERGQAAEYNTGERSTGHDLAERLLRQIRGWKPPLALGYHWRWVIEALCRFEHAHASKNSGQFE